MRYFTAFLLFALSLFAQSPDVAQYLTFTAATAGAPVFVGAGGPNGAVAWRLTYYVDGTAITAAQVAIQGADAPTVAGCSVGGLVWTTITTAGSSLVEAVNPSASAAQGNIAVKSFYPCIRANVTAITGAAGTVKTALYGYKTVWVFPTPAIVIPSGTQDVNLIQIDGTAVPSAGVLGALPVGGTVATNGLLSASAYPQLFAGEDYAATPHIQVPKVDSSGRAVIQGDAASGATASGNPVKMGGVFNTTQPTVTNGQVVDEQATARGAVIIASGVDPINVTPAANSTVDVAKVGGTAVPSAGVAGSMPVGGTVAAGGNLSAANYPVPMAGSDYGGTPKVYIPKVDSSGNLFVTATSTVSGTVTANQGTAGAAAWPIGGLAAAGAAPTSNPVPQGLQDSAGHLVIPDYCTLKAVIASPAVGITLLVAHSGTTTIRICKWSFTTDNLTTAQLFTGTTSKTSCDGAVVNETHVYTGAGGGVFGILEDYASPLITTAGSDLCIGLSAGVTAAGGITIEYSQR